MVEVNDVLRARGATAFVCECAANGCIALVELPLAVYDGIRAVDRSVLAEGHPAAPAPDESVSPVPREHELPLLRESLRARVNDVWDRLNDVVSELRELHDVPREQIVERLDDALEATDQDPRTP